MLHSIIGASDFGSTALEWIEAASLEFTFASVGVLGLLVLIRTFLGWALLVEMEGRWPWQGHARAHRYEPPAGEPREVKLNSSRRYDMRRRGLASTVARTAVIAGTATVVSGAVAGSQQQKAAAKQQAAAQQQAQAEAAAQEAAAQQQAQIDAAAQAAAAAVAEQMTAQAPAAETAAAGITDEVIAQLQKLGELKAAGVLSDEEFATLKAKLING